MVALIRTFERKETFRRTFEQVFFRESLLDRQDYIYNLALHFAGNNFARDLIRSIQARLTVGRKQKDVKMDKAMHFE